MLKPLITTAPNPPKLALDWTKVCFKPSDDECTMLGTLELGGITFHVWAIGMEEGIDGSMVEINDPYERLLNVARAFGDDPHQTIEIPGFKGRWVIVLEPYSR